MSEYNGVDFETMKMLDENSHTVGQEVYQFGLSHMLIFPVALPIAVKTTHASHSEPYLSVKLSLDPQRIAELALKVYPQGMPAVRNWSAGYVISADLGMVKAVTRLVECLSNPGDAELLLTENDSRIPVIIYKVTEEVPI